MRTFLRSILLVILTSSLATAQTSPLDLIPESTAVVVRFQAPQSITNDLAAFIDKVQPGFGDIARAQVASGLGRAISNANLAGVDQTKEIYVLVFAEGGRNMNGILLIPATDASAVKEAMGASFEYIEKDGWLACTKKTKPVADFQRCLDGELKSISTTLDDPTKALLTSGHLGVAVNAAVLKKAFAEELASAEGRLEEVIAAMTQQLRKSNPELDVTYISDMYRDFGKFCLQVVTDSTSAAVSIRLTEDALQIDKLLTVESGSSTEAIFLTQPVSDMSRLTSLPEGLMGYTAAHGDPRVLLEWSEGLTSKIFKDEEQKQKFAKIFALMKTATFGTMAAGGDLDASQPDALRYFAVSEITPSSALMEGLALLGTGMEYEVAGIRQKQTVESGVEEVDGNKVTILRMEQTLPPGLDPTGIQKAMNEKMYGPDGIVQRLVMKDNLFLQTMGGGLDAMKRLLATTSSWTNPDLLKARARQHEQANLLVLVDFPNSVKKFAALLLGTGVIPIPVKPEQLDELVLAPTYSGFSLAVDKKRLSMRMCMPINSFQRIVQIGMFAQGLAAGVR